MMSHANAPADPSPKRLYRVLLVDDEPGILRMYKAALANHEYVAELASNIQEAMALIEKGEFDAIVTDINMPGVEVSSSCAACASMISTCRLS